MSKIQTRQQFKDYCLENKYSKWYFSIVESALNRAWTKKTAPVYVENHHIFPKCIVKNNDVVCLTAREHFICHLLLPKMMVNTEHRVKMMIAIHRLIFGNKKHEPIYVKNSNQYENIKKKCSEFFSQRNKNYWNSLTKEQKSFLRSGKNNSMFGKKQKESTKQLISQKAKDRLKDKSRHPLYGIGHSEETKKLMSEKKKLNNPVTGKKWYHNPIEKIEKYFSINSQPENFILGRLPK
jgi:hypothetical protein